MGRIAKCLAAAAAALLSCAAWGQSVAWSRTLNGPGGAAAYLGDAAFAGRTIAADAAGNLVVAGSYANGGQRDLLVTRLAADGTIAWQKSFAGAAKKDDMALSVSLDRSGNALVAGSSANAGNSDIVVIKYAAANGAVLWQKVIDGGYDDVAYLVASDAAGNAIVAAESMNANGNWDIRVLELAAASGALSWDKRYDSGSDDHVSDLVVDGKGNAIVLGTRQAASGADIVVLAYAGANGAVAWQRTLDSGGDDKGYGLALGPTGDVYLAGFQVTTTGASLVAARLAGASGATVWSSRYDAGGGNFGEAIAVDRAGNAIVTGESMNAAGHFVFDTLAFAAANGALLWQRTYDGGANDYPYLVALGGDGNAIVAGASTVNGQLDWKVIAYAAAGGAQAYQYGYAGSANLDDQAYGLAAVPGGVVVAGSAAEANAQPGVRLVKLVPAAQGTAAVTSLVPHFYATILRRAPDAGGEAFWNGEVTRLKGLGADPNEVWYAMANAFFTSPEYAAFGRDDTGFVGDLYHAFFDRDPDAAGLAYWKGLLAQGLPREVALVSFMFSPEFSAYVQGLFGGTPVRPEVNLVMDFYRGVLGRLPDSAGFQYWVQQFRAAQCQGPQSVYGQVQAISNAFLHSAEYAGRGRNSALYVADLYNAFLRRGGDLAGVKYWIAQAGASNREAVLASFVSSPEFAARVTAVASAPCVR